jgi:hypothetical protein
MPTLNLRPAFLSEQESQVIASRRLLSFLTLPDSEGEKKRVARGAESAPRKPLLRRLLSFLIFLATKIWKKHIAHGAGSAPSKSLFSFAALPKDAFTTGPALFNWTNRDIYDVDGRLLFRDQTIKLDRGNELQVRTAGSDLLRTPVWSVRAGPVLDVEGQITKALSALGERCDLKPLLVDDEATVRLVCYSYPKLGILCYSLEDPAVRSVIDLWELNIIPLDYSEQCPPAESVITVWSPYDFVVPATLGHYCSKWRRNIALLPALPKSVEALPMAIMEARTSILEECTTQPELTLVGQLTNTFCAAATAKMILLYYGIEPDGIHPKQGTIATDMHTNRSTGADPVDQVNAIPTLTHDKLLAELDETTSFSEAKEEIRQGRPFKTGGASHARACDGFKVEEGEQNWLHIYDPWPPNQGQISYEAWEAGHHINYMYVRPKLPFLSE